MRLPDSLVEGIFLERLNRFAASVQVAGKPVLAHVPNSGRMTELLQRGALALLTPVRGGQRKTPYDLTLIHHKDQWVGVDARLPNPLFAEAVSSGRLPDFAYASIQHEVRWGQSRFDFLLSTAEGNGSPGSRCLVETKSVNLVEDGLALFPDAPTSRGVRHVEELIAARQAGWQAAVVFIIQRSDAEALSPHHRADPAFAEALAAAARAGVCLRAYTCRVSPREIVIADEVPVRLP